MSEWMYDWMKEGLKWTELIIDLIKLLEAERIIRTVDSMKEWIS